MVGRKSERRTQVGIKAAPPARASSQGNDLGTLVLMAITIAAAFASVGYLAYLVVALIASLFGISLILLAGSA